MDMPGDYEKRIIQALQAKMPDGLPVQDYLEDCIPSKADLDLMGINTSGYELSDIRADIYEDFYRLLVHTILDAAYPTKPKGN